jgi:hypothetical protein
MGMAMTMGNLINRARAKERDEEAFREGVKAARAALEVNESLRKLASYRLCGAEQQPEAIAFMQDKYPSRVAISAKQIGHLQGAAELHDAGVARANAYLAECEKVLLTDDDDMFMSGLVIDEAIDIRTRMERGRPIHVEIVS